jgi:hypothetical protein
VESSGQQSSTAHDVAVLAGYGTPGNGTHRPANVSQTITLTGVQGAFAAMERGAVIRSFISFEQ